MRCRDVSYPPLESIPQLERSPQSFAECTGFSPIRQAHFSTPQCRKTGSELPSFLPLSSPDPPFLHEVARKLTARRKTNVFASLTSGLGGNDENKRRWSTKRADPEAW
jgi:hypothetical protein